MKTQKDTYRVHEERWMIKAGGGNKRMNKQIVESGVKFGGWQKSPETNNPHIS